MKAMILAAGRGSRMAPLTDNCPKPLLSVAGKPLIQHHIEKLVDAGITEIVINTAWLGEQIESELGDGTRFGAQLFYSREGAGGLETGGGVYHALPLLGKDPFLLVNGDIWTDWSYHGAWSMAESLSQQHALACLLLVNNPPHHPEGDFFWKNYSEDIDREPSDTGNTVTKRGDSAQNRIKWLANHGEQKLTFSGLSILSPELWQGHGAGFYPLAPMLRAAIASDRVLALHCQTSWVDVGTPERLAELDNRLRSQQVNKQA